MRSNGTVEVGSALEWVDAVDGAGTGAGWAGAGAGGADWGGVAIVLGNWACDLSCQYERTTCEIRRVCGQKVLESRDDIIREVLARTVDLGERSRPLNSGWESKCHLELQFQRARRIWILPTNSENYRCTDFRTPTGRENLPWGSAL